jgi:hypothetical protein
LKKAGMPVTNQHRLSYTDIVPMDLLAFDHVVDFVPNVAPYENDHHRRIRHQPTGRAHGPDD